MIFIRDSKSAISPFIGEIIKSIKNNIYFLFFISLIFSSTFCLFNLSVVEASTIQNDNLIEKISKDFTKKFCNSIAFGLSEESAMTFSNKENNLIFKNKKGFQSLNKESIANKIAISVMDDCGYLIDMKGENEVKEFEQKYLLMNNYSLD